MQPHYYRVGSQNGLHILGLCSFAKWLGDGVVNEMLSTVVLEADRWLLISSWIKSHVALLIQWEPEGGDGVWCFAWIRRVSGGSDEGVLSRVQPLHVDLLGYFPGPS